VPVLTGDSDHPLKLVDFPSRSVFDALYGVRVSRENVERYYKMLRARANGATLADSAALYGVTRERVRQIEARFLRLMRDYLATQPASDQP